MSAVLRLSQLLCLSQIFLVHIFDLIVRYMIYDTGIVGKSVFASGSLFFEAEFS